MAKFSNQIVRTQATRLGGLTAESMEATRQDAEMNYVLVTHMVTFAKFNVSPMTHPSGLWVRPDGRITLKGVVMDKYEAVRRLTIGS